MFSILVTKPEQVCIVLQGQQCQCSCFVQIGSVAMRSVLMKLSGQDRAVVRFHSAQNPVAEAVALSIECPSLPSTVFCALPPFRLPSVGEQRQVMMERVRASRDLRPRQLSPPSLPASTPPFDPPDHVYSHWICKCIFYTPVMYGEAKRFKLHKVKDQRRCLICIGTTQRKYIAG